MNQDGLVTRRDAASTYATDFGGVDASAFFVEPTRIATAGPGTRLQHQQAASIAATPSGDLLVTCRWDARGAHEGDASNEQALYVSHDVGRSWRMANGGEPIVTLVDGTSFDQPSAITHSFVFTDGADRTWLYYTVNQPFTWGADRPDRATGGGEIRRILLTRYADDWTSTGTSEVVWGFQWPIDDGRGGLWTDVRVVCLNGVVRLRSGRLVMPVAGRATVPDPKGAFWPLDRCWVLSSSDDGRTWSDSHFIGGGPSLCLCEPTVVETAEDDRLLAFMRVQYDTGLELYRSESVDGGRHWSSPVAAGLPNTRGSGVKPYLTRLRDGRYALLQTHEHLVEDRTNVSLFVTDEDGLAQNRWPLVKVLHAECRQGWQGAGYGWLAESHDGGLHAVWVSFDAEHNHLNHSRLNPDWLAATVIEPLAPRDVHGDHLPHLRPGPHGGTGLFFPHVRSRAHAPHFGATTDGPAFVRLRYEVDQLPRRDDVPLLDLRANHGRHPWLALAVRPGHSTTVWLAANLGWYDTGVAIMEGAGLEVLVRVTSPLTAAIEVNGHKLPGPVQALCASPPSTLYLGGNVEGSDAIGLTLVEAAYGPWHDVATDRGANP